MADRSHYDVLGITVRATPEEVRAAYRRAARDHHPDAGGDAGRMSDLNAAWHVLGDPHRRAAYDRQLARRPAAGHGTAASAPPFVAADADGAWDVDGGTYRSADEWADLADARPLRQTRALEGWWAILPPATLLAAVTLIFGAFIFGAPSLLAVAGGLLVLALGLFVLAPLRAMSRRDGS
jgi:curved DNA-binding protein CbpA